MMSCHVCTFLSQYHNLICVYMRSTSAQPSPSGDESGLCLTNVVYDSPFLSTCSLLGLLGVRMTSILFRMHPSHFHAPINSDSQLLPSTPRNQPLCPSPTCLPPVFTMLQQLFKLLCCLESMGIVFFVDVTLPSELPLASSSRLQSVHCLLPVSEGTFPLYLPIPHNHHTSAHFLKAPILLTAHIDHLPIPFRVFSVFYSGRARCTCIFTSFF
jgi:hypothetical protein